LDLRVGAVGLALACIQKPIQLKRSSLA
jgi:hypothetical protein